ncbi:MAG: hypothetical protein R6X16_13660 [Anaerolineae bacterium]
MPKIRRRRTALYLWALLLVLLAYFATSLSVAAQGPDWSEPIQLNTSDGVTPAIVVDNAGDVHVFWGSQSDLAPGALFHTRLSRGVWGMPTDVLISPTGDRAQYPSAVVDRAGVIHLVWAGDAIYYSYARQENADLARGWSAPRVLSTGQATTPSIALDGQGHLHVLYADIYHSPHIRHTASTDGGASWREPVIVSAPQRGAVAINADLAIDQNDVMHAIWAETIEDFPPSGVYYSRSEDQGLTWSSPFAVAVGGYSWGSIGVDAENNVHLFWTGTGDWAGKYHRWSTDRGKSWTETQRVWPEMAGLLSFATLLAATDGGFHIVAPASGWQSDPLSSGDIWHAAWVDGQWARPTDISVGMWDRRRENHSPQAAFGVDGTLHVVWDMANPLLEGGEPSSLVWYAARAPAGGAQSRPTLGVSTPVPLATAPTAVPTSEGSLTSADGPMTQATLSLGGSPSAAAPLALGTVAAGVVAIGAFVLALRSRRR